MSFILLGILNSQAAGAGGGPAFEFIQSATTSGTSLTFSSIPTDYKHLQIRALLRTNNNSADQIRVRLNGDTGANYSHHYLQGNASSISRAFGTNDTSFFLGSQPTSSGDPIFSAMTLDLLDYSSTTKTTTINALHGYAGSAYRNFLTSGTWANTAAVSSITIFPNTANFASAKFAIYGVKG